MRLRRIVPVPLLLLPLLVAPGSAGAATCNVSPGGGTPLKDAILDFNCTVIRLAPGTFNEDNIDIPRDVTIHGAGGGGPGSTTITNSGTEYSVLHVTNPVTVKVTDVVITGGNLFDSIDDNGGGVDTANGSDVTLKRVTVESNSADFGGGGIHVPSGATLHLDDVLVGANFTGEYTGNGGGILNFGTVEGSRVRIAANEATEAGGGLFNAGTVTLIDSSISNNDTATNDAFGGGIFNSGTLSLTNVAIVGNDLSGTGTDGGAIHDQAASPMESTFTNVTVSANSSTAGGGGILKTNSGTLTLAFNTIADNHTTSGAGGSTTSGAP